MFVRLSSSIIKKNMHNRQNLNEIKKYEKIMHFSNIVHVGENIVHVGVYDFMPIVTYASLNAWTYYNPKKKIFIQPAFEDDIIHSINRQAMYVVGGFFWPITITVCGFNILG